ncbi:hypothetical protein [Flavobacterium salmonis]|uniref:HMA domain-containing protein n=1 Tax=Flavobacterium salmonis TaxID=2654844 RepID=A0A6V6YWQ4_9FLAO|nr:hypothetical protein [Flavobacterium salmonis]CAD0003968.1 hypothetical protein FLAT13_01976 [Flavobacterium salmonis]
MIYVFITSVKTEQEVGQLKPHLNDLLKQAKWNFDLEDCDKILRIDIETEITQSIINLLKDKGFYCEELVD